MGRGGGGGGGGGYRGGGSRSDACYDWRAGRCNRGSSCKFSHDDNADRGGGGGGGGGGGRDYGECNWLLGANLESLTYPLKYLY